MKIHNLHFHNELIVSPILSDKNDKWELKDWYAVSFIIDNDPKRKFIFVPKGYITDFGSIPQLAWPIVGSPAVGDHRRGTIFHDWIFAMHSQSFEFANELFRVISIYDGLSFWKRVLIIGAVKTAGFIAWKRWREKDLTNHYYVLHHKQIKENDEFKNMEWYG